MKYEISQIYVNIFSKINPGEEVPVLEYSSLAPGMNQTN